MEKKSLSRKLFVPWYDQGTACYLSIGFFFVILLFSIEGIVVSSGGPQYTKYIWLPFLLASMCSYAIVSIVIRLIIRRIQLKRDKN